MSSEIGHWSPNDSISPPALFQLFLFADGHSLDSPRPLPEHSLASPLKASQKKKKRAY
jgi:hypothetical protein